MSKISQFFVKSNAKFDSREEFLSESKQYKLVVTPYGTSPGCWSYTQGLVYKIGGDTPIAEVQRNYSSFPYLFIDSHPNEHSYLVCGANYQGQTVIELDTGKRRDFVPEEAKKGFGFCWASYKFDVSSQMLIVEGCFWAGPYEFRFYDFSDPMAGWPEIEFDEVYADDKWPTIEADGIIKCYQTESSADEDDDDDDDDEEKERPIVAFKTFRREGLKLILVEEWISDKEKDVRAKREEAHRKYEQWLKDFKANDSLYVLMKKLAKDPIFKSENGISIGVTYDKWCPHFQGNERRMCRRIHQDEKITLDIEWGVETGPIKLVVYRGGKHIEDKWFEHSVAGMTEAFAYTKMTVRCHESVISRVSQWFQLFARKRR